MPEDWLTEDPFTDPLDSADLEREQRRREREMRRSERELRNGEQEARRAERAPEPPKGPPRSHRAGALLAAVRRRPLRFLAVIAAVLVLWFLWALFQPFHGAGWGRVVVTIPRGAGASEVGDLLDKDGVVSNSLLFQLRATLAGKRSDFYPGRYVLAHEMSYGAAIGALTHPAVATSATVTIPEGYDRPQAARLAREAGLRGSYMRASTRSPGFDPARYGARGAKNLEGFLFPDTFQLKRGATAADLVRLQLRDFERRMRGISMAYARSKNLTTYDVLTIASMIEREAQLPSQRALVAAVIYNRLREGIPLGIDSTIRFATGNYTRPLTESELAISSPYNTRLNAGLPPGPIDSPGLASIEAAAHPAHVGYLYYVVKPGGCGALTFSSTSAQFERDVARYRAATAAKGEIASPTCRK